MTTAQLLLLLVVAVLANVALMTLVAFPALSGRGGRRVEAPVAQAPPEPVDIALEVAAGQAAEAPEGRAGLSIATYDRVVAIVSWAFLIGTAAIVFLGGLYPTTAPAIYVLLAAAALFVLVVHHLAPNSLLGAGKFLVEGSAAIAFFTLLIALTGGVDSPFFFGYYLVVAGAALVVGGVTTFVLASTTSIVYLLSIAAQPGSDQLTLDQLARVGFNTLALWLLSYLGFVLAHEQRRTRDAALRLSLFDPLTQLYNRNYFFAVLDRELQRASRSGRGFCLLMLDMDDLKPINDTFGHHYGDDMLRAVADVVRGGIRQIDAPARYGGDEFVVLLPETEAAGAIVVAEKLRQSVADIRLMAGDKEVSTTVSIGVVSYPEDGVSGDQLLMRADAAMYEGKRGGKARVARGQGAARAASGRTSTRRRAVQIERAPDAQAVPAVAAMRIGEEQALAVPALDEAQPASRPHLVEQPTPMERPTLVDAASAAEPAAVAEAAAAGEAQDLTEPQTAARPRVVEPHVAVDSPSADFVPPIARVAATPPVRVAERPRLVERPRPAASLPRGERPAPQEHVERAERRAPREHVERSEPARVAEHVATSEPAASAVAIAEPIAEPAAWSMATVPAPGAAEPTASVPPHAPVQRVAPAEPAVEPAATTAKATRATSASRPATTGAGDHAWMPVPSGPIGDSTRARPTPAPRPRREPRSGRRSSPESPSGGEASAPPEAAAQPTTPVPPEPAETVATESTTPATRAKPASRSAAKADPTRRRTSTPRKFRMVAHDDDDRVDRTMNRLLNGHTKSQAARKAPTDASPTEPDADGR